MAYNNKKVRDIFGCHSLFVSKPSKSKKGKVFSGQEPPSGEFTTTECAVNYQLLAVI